MRNCVYHFIDFLMQYPKDMSSLLFCMLPPPPGQFASRDELLAHVRAFALTQGYAVTVKRSRTDVNGEVKNLMLRCDRGGSYGNKLNLTADLRRRQTFRLSI